MKVRKELKPEELEALLNSLGEGWEIVEVRGIRCDPYGYLDYEILIRDLISPRILKGIWRAGESARDIFLEEE